MTEHGWHRALGLLVFALLFALAMVGSWLSDPFDPTLVGTDAYGHNGEGALPLGLALLAVEAGVAVLALVPWKRNGYILTGARYSILLLPWVFSMHQGGVVMVHLMWLVSLWLLMVGITMWGVARKLIA